MNHIVHSHLIKIIFCANSGNGLEPKRWQAINLTNDDPVPGPGLFSAKTLSKSMII